MALDPSIILGAQPIKIDNPLLMAGQVAQLQQAQNQNRLADLIFGEKQREISDMADTRSAIAAANGDLGVARSNLLSKGLYRPAMDLGKSQLELDEKKSNIAKNNATATKTGLEATNIALTQHRSMLNNVNDIQGAQQWLVAGYQNPDTKPIFERYGPLSEALSRLQQTVTDPTSFQRWKMGASMNADDLIKYTTPDANTVANNQTSMRNNDATNATSRANNAATVSATIRGQNLTDARTREQIAQGKIPSGYRLAPDGQSLVPIPGGPADQANAKPSAEYMKQAEAYQNMDDALGNYKNVLSKFGGLDSLSPSKRAELNTAYQNSLLQAKEIYRLGVLNGGDERILKAIINNPLDLTSTLVPKEALLKQASDLQGIIQRNNENLAKVSKQKAIPLNSQTAPAPAAAPANSIPEGAIKMLRSNPSLRPQFEAKYGPGSAATALGQ
jgi:hypothetical protein